MSKLLAPFKIRRDDASGMPSWENGGRVLIEIVPGPNAQRRFACYTLAHRGIVEGVRAAHRWLLTGEGAVPVAGVSDHGSEDD